MSLRWALPLSLLLLLPPLLGARADLCLQKKLASRLPAETTAASPASTVIDSRPIRFQNEFIPQLLEAARKSQYEADPYAPGGVSPFVRYYETLDRGLRSQEHVPTLLLTQALRRLPYLQESPFNLFLSGGAAKAWAAPLENLAREKGLRVSIIRLPGSLSRQPGRPVREMPKFPAALKERIQRYPSIFVDDTYSVGETATAIANAIQADGGRLEGVFVAIDEGLGDASALFRSGRYARLARPRPPVFPTPRSWSWNEGPVRLGLELEKTVLLETGALSPQGQRLLRELVTLEAPVRFLKNGRPVSAPQVIKTAFPALRELPRGADFDLAIGNRGRSFIPGEAVATPPGRQTALETVAIHSDGGGFLSPSEVPVRRFGAQDLPEEYLLNRLVEVGVLKPHFPDRGRPAPSLAEVNVIDLRETAEWQRRYLERLRTGQLGFDTRYAEHLVPEVSWKDLSEPFRQQVIASALAHGGANAYLLAVIRESKDPRFLPLLNELSTKTITDRDRATGRALERYIKGKGPSPSLARLREMRNNRTQAKQLDELRELLSNEPSQRQ